MSRKLTLIITVLLALLWSSNLMAHSQLVESSPRDGEHLQSPPAALHLQFNEPVRLLNVELVGEKHGELSINFQRSRQQREHYQLDLPTLSSDTYNATWTLIGQDGHRVSGTIKFIVRDEQRD